MYVKRYNVVNVQICQFKYCCKKRDKEGGGREKKGRKKWAEEKKKRKEKNWDVYFQMTQLLIESPRQRIDLFHLELWNIRKWNVNPEC